MALEDLTRYQWARLARENIESKERLPYAVEAMQKYYSSNFRDFDEDPLLQEAFADARAGIQAGHLTSRGVLAAIGHYSGKYEKARDDSTIEDIVKSAEQAGYELPQEAKEALVKYSSMKYSELEKLAKDKDKKDEDAQRAYLAVQMLERQKFDGQLYKTLVTEMTDKSLKGLFKKEENREELREAA